MRPDARSLPALFVERLRRIVPSGAAEAILTTFTRSKPTTFRANTLKAGPARVREQLADAGFRVERVPWYPDAMILRSGRLRELQETLLYAGGMIYVQSLSSMLPPLILEPQPGESVLDITAAPGSKTTQMACLMRGSGRLVANDNNKVRFFKLKANVEQQGAANVEATLRYGEAFGREHPDAFDRVLADVPCTAEGRFLASEPKTFGYWKPAKIKAMAYKQKQLLYAALCALKPGGLLVYSTCTFAPEENEGVIHWALKKFEGRVAVEPLTLSLPNMAAGLPEWDGVVFDPSVRGTKRVLPTDDMEGFFLARLRKSG